MRHFSRFTNVAVIGLIDTCRAQLDPAS